MLTDEQAREVKNQLCIDGTLNKALDAILAGNKPDTIFNMLTGLAHDAVDRAASTTRGEAHRELFFAAYNLLDSVCEDHPAIADVFSVSDHAKLCDALAALDDFYGVTSPESRAALSAIPQPAEQEETSSVLMTWEQLENRSHRIFTNKSLFQEFAQVSAQPALTVEPVATRGYAHPHVAVIVNNNQPGWTFIAETEPHVTLDVGTKLYRVPVGTMSGLRELLADVEAKEAATPPAAPVSRETPDTGTEALAAFDRLVSLIPRYCQGDEEQADAALVIGALRRPPSRETVQAASDAPATALEMLATAEKALHKATANVTRAQHYLQSTDEVGTIEQARAARNKFRVGDRVIDRKGWDDGVATVTEITARGFAWKLDKRHVDRDFSYDSGEALDASGWEIAP